MNNRYIVSAALIGAALLAACGRQPSTPDPRVDGVAPRVALLSIDPNTREPAILGKPTALRTGGTGSTPTRPPAAGGATPTISPESGPASTMPIVAPESAPPIPTPPDLGGG